MPWRTSQNIDEQNVGSNDYSHRANNADFQSPNWQTMLISNHQIVQSTHRGHDGIVENFKHDDVKMHRYKWPQKINVSFNPYLSASNSVIIVMHHRTISNEYAKPTGCSTGWSFRRLDRSWKNMHEKTKWIDNRSEETVERECVGTHRDGAGAILQDRQASLQSRWDGHINDHSRLTPDIFHARIVRPSRAFFEVYQC